MSILTILFKNIKWRFHNRFTIIITVLQPMLWLVLYSTIAQQTMQNTGIKNYTAFMLPGLIVLVLFSTCSSSGIMNYIIKSNGSFYRILIAPISRASIVLGQVFEAVLCSFFEIGIMGLISLFFSAKLLNGFINSLTLCLLIFLTAFFVASFSYGVSLILPNEIVYETVMNAIVLPTFFLSSALFPVDKIEGVLKVLIHLNPFTHVIDCLRFIILTGEIPYNTFIKSLFLLIILGILAFLFAIWQLNRETEL